MSEETLHKQKFQVDQWPTSKVTLYPTRASIVRQIEGVKLKSGLNEITISDLTSLADPDSVRVAGTTDNHPARINDLTIDLVPNKYSSLSDVSDSDSESDDDEDEEPTSLKAAKEALDKITTKIKEVDEHRSSAQKELSFVEKYASTVASSTSSTTIPDPKTMKDTLDLYNKQRAALFDAITAFDRDLVELAKERVKKAKVLDKEKQAFGKAIRAKVEARKKKKADKDERKREKNEKKPEKSSTVHRVRITIELPLSDLTAQASNTETAEVFQDATLTLTYTTTSASWTPHYDLRLDTTNPSLSSLTYRAHFTNRTYETWSQAAITLSTSQASFGGLKEKIPQMEGWRVTLAKKWNTISIANGENGLYSLAELNAKKEAEQKEYGIDVVARHSWEVDQVDHLHQQSRHHLRAQRDFEHPPLLVGK
ncbi:hypothetical protein PILCRDRAFT_7873 [Piloderma croceum F 1598]|uniref:DUF4140 domain-containing protein n=1 Tax=Piloderma croceum (strain F 1598) TaxID=765440 RepID=A0A0C3B849_PILCF|nr:hypothetical protein PILCRDRAFT_7873 [Piloderma croceum F 1598]